MLTQRVLVGFVISTATIGTAVGLTSLSGASEPCGAALSASVGESSRLALGLDTTALMGDQVVTIDPAGSRTSYALPELAPGAIARHIARAPGFGTAFVEDRAGSDAIRIISAEGASVLPTSEEVAHPSWSDAGELAWVADMRQLVIRLAAEATKRIEPPAGVSAIFSPFFLSPSRIVVAAQERAGDASGYASDNLWELDRLTGRWRRLTDLRTAGDTWSVIRTPIQATDGSILFVRVNGVASVTEPPVYELWRVAGGPHLVRTLPGEMYLAGIEGTSLLWNVERDDEWRLYQEGPDGMRELGCGAVQVDPRSQVDPDLVPSNSDVKLAPEGLAGMDPGAAQSPEAEAEMGILIGDFANEQDAREAARQLGLEGLRIVNHGQAPYALRPGVWGVALALPPSVGVESELAELRLRFPELEDRSWIVVLSGGDA